MFAANPMESLRAKVQRKSLGDHSGGQSSNGAGHKLALHCNGPFHLWSLTGAQSVVGPIVEPLVVLHILSTLVRSTRLQGAFLGILLQESWVLLIGRLSFHSTLLELWCKIGQHAHHLTIPLIGHSSLLELLVVGSFGLEINQLIAQNYHD